MNVVLIALYVVFAVGGSTLIKYGSTLKGAAFVVPFVNVTFTPVSLAGIFCYGLSFILYTFLLSKFELSVISPVTIGLVYVLLMATAVLVFGEHFTIMKTVGCFLVLAGILSIVLAK